MITAHKLPLQLKTHILNNHERHSCSSCDFSATTSKVLMLHIEKKHAGNAVAQQADFGGDEQQGWKLMSCRQVRVES